MNFLAPLFALGALAVAAPIIFHLIRRTTRESTAFSSLMFLEPSPPRITRRSRLENLWLLLLRCLVIALLAAGFARPFWRNLEIGNELSASAAKRIVILLDTSASMRREGLWASARRQAEELLRNAAPVDQVAVLTFDDQVRTLVDFPEWREAAPNARADAVISRLASVSPTWRSTHLDNALTTAAERLLETGTERSSNAEVVVISDLQEGARLDGLQAYEWPRGVMVTLSPVKSSAHENAGLQWLAESEETQKTSDDVPLRVRVTNAADNKHEQFHLQWHNAAGAPSGEAMDAYIPAGQSRVVKPPKPAVTDTSLVLSGDDEDFDNTLYIIPPQPVETPILFLGKDAPDDPHGLLYYLQRAFPKTRRQNVEIIAQAGDDAVPAFQLQRAQLAVLGDGASEKAVDSLREFSKSGKIALVPLTSATEASALAFLRSTNAEFSMSEAPVKDYALLGQIQFDHPLFSAFADPRFSDFTKIHFWKYRRLDLAALGKESRLLARFDNGDPAVMESPQGNVILFASSWRPEDSQLALSSKFVPLMQALLERSSKVVQQKAQYFVGDSVVVAAGGQEVSVKKPDGSSVTVPADQSFAGTDQPGVYTIEPSGHRFVVNLAPEESRTAPLPVERLAGLGVPLNQTKVLSAKERAQREALAQASELENRQKLWRWLLAAAIGCLLLETAIATKLSRHAAKPQYSPI